MRRKVATRLREWWGDIAAKAQVAESQDFAVTAEAVGVADGARTPLAGPELAAGSY